MQRMPLPQAPDFRAVVVVDAHKGVGAGRARRHERHQLIVGRAVRLRGGARLGRR